MNFDLVQCLECGVEGLSVSRPRKRPRKRRWSGIQNFLLMVRVVLGLLQILGLQVCMGAVRQSEDLHHGCQLTAMFRRSVFTVTNPGAGTWRPTSKR